LCSLPVCFTDISRRTGFWSCPAIAMYYSLNTIQIFFHAISQEKRSACLNSNNSTREPMPDFNSHTTSRPAHPDHHAPVPTTNTSSTQAITAPPTQSSQQRCGVLCHHRRNSACRACICRGAAEMVEDVVADTILSSPAVMVTGTKLELIVDSMPPKP
jgi:hypothetical protein